mmetsp:Transcript_27625/g.67974  ORF Transcript_27625/g.67974 Transcript_27625/m.67974 type:complete len:123 (+) Transcript_27625:185-553(+)
MLLGMRNRLCSSRGHQFQWLLVRGQADHDVLDPTHRIPKCGRRHGSVVHNVSVVSRLAGVAGRNRHRGVEQQNTSLEFVRDPERFGAAVRDAGFTNVDPDSVDPVVGRGRCRLNPPPGVDRA